MTRHGAIAPVLTAAALVLAAAALPWHPALALTTETYQVTPNGRYNLSDPGAVPDRLRGNLSQERDGSGSTDGRAPGLTFGSPDSGTLTFSVGPTQSSDPFRDRFMRFGPPPGSR